MPGGSNESVIVEMVLGGVWNRNHLGFFKTQIYILTLYLLSGNLIN